MKFTRRRFIGFTAAGAAVAVLPKVAAKLPPVVTRKAIPSTAPMLWFDASDGASYDLQGTHVNIWRSKGSLGSAGDLLSGPRPSVAG